MQQNAAIWREEIDRIAAGAFGDARIRVAVVDGPADLSHRCLTAGRLEILESPSSDVAAHGTAIASILFGSNGIHGIAPGCRGLIIPVLQNQDGMLSASQLDIARGIALALSHGASIINISAGQLGVTPHPHPYLAEMVRRAEEQNVLIVAAAGNDGCACVHVPAAVGSVLAVGAMDDDGQPLPLSNWGAAYRDHAVLAPGKNIPGAAPGGDTALYSGTSWATAVVSGFAALLLSEQLRRGERPDPKRVRDVILETAVSLDAPETSGNERHVAGRLNIAAAWKKLAEGRKKTMTIDELQFPGLAAGGPSRSTQRQRVSASGCECGGSGSDCSCAGTGKSEASGSDCACGGTSKSETPGKSCGCSAKAPPQLVYVLGQLGYDFISQARRDSLMQQGLTNPHDPAELLRHLENHPSVASAVTWTLVHDATPIYAIQPMGAFAAETYLRLRTYLGQQSTENVERISVPGWITGKVPLSSGQLVPMIIPELRGMYSWTTSALVSAVLSGPPDDESGARGDELRNFLDRIYYELRNLGILPQDRAINYAATNAFQAGEAYARAARAGLKLDSIAAEPSPICRPDSQCWDVKLTFFHPARRLDQAREVYRFTVDVSDVVPVAVGPMRNWHLY